MKREIYKETDKYIYIVEYSNDKCEDKDGHIRCDCRTYYTRLEKI